MIQPLKLATLIFSVAIKKFYFLLIIYRIYDLYLRLRLILNLNKKIPKNKNKNSKTASAEAVEWHHETQPKSWIQFIFLINFVPNGDVPVQYMHLDEVDL